jgi:hypothetical protein
MAIFERLQDWLLSRQARVVENRAAKVTSGAFNAVTLDDKNINSPQHAGLLKHLNEVCPQAMTGMNYSDLSPELRARFEPAELWEQNLRDNPRSKDFKREITAYGRNPLNNEVTLAVVSSAFDISPNIERLLKIRPELQETYKFKPGQQEWFVAYGYVFDGGERKATPELVAMAATEHLAGFAAKLPGNISGLFFETNNTKMTGADAPDIAVENLTKPLESVFHKKSHSLPKYVQPPLEFGGEYSYGLKPNFIAGPGYSHIPAIRELAFLDKYYQVCSGRGVDWHAERNPDVKEMVDRLHERITVEHNAAIEKDRDDNGKFSLAQCFKDFGKASAFASAIAEVGEAASKFLDTLRNFSNKPIGRLAFWSTVIVAEYQCDIDDEPNYAAPRIEAVGSAKSMAASGGTPPNKKEVSVVPPPLPENEKNAAADKPSPILQALLVEKLEIRSIPRSFEIPAVQSRA